VLDVGTQVLARPPSPPRFGTVDF